jgi:hypothetical protein
MKKVERVFLMVLAAESASVEEGRPKGSVVRKYSFHNRRHVKEKELYVENFWQPSESEWGDSGKRVSRDD